MCLAFAAISFLQYPLAGRRFIIFILSVASGSRHWLYHVPCKVGEWQATYFCPSAPSSSPARLRPWNFQKKKVAGKAETNALWGMILRCWGKDTDKCHGSFFSAVKEAHGHNLRAQAQLKLEPVKQ